jgi:hypothetical protein
MDGVDMSEEAVKEDMVNSFSHAALADDYHPEVSDNDDE